MTRKAAYLLLLAVVLAFGVPATAFAQSLTVTPAIINENQPSVSVSVSVTGAVANALYRLATGNCNTSVVGLTAASGTTDSSGAVTITTTLRTGDVTTDHTCAMRALPDAGGRTSTVRLSSGAPTGR